MRLRILGPLEVEAAEGPVPLGGPKPRALLAALLVEPGRVVSADRLTAAPEVAGPERDRFRDGAWLVELAALPDGGPVGHAVAAVLGVQQRHGRSIDRSLVEYLTLDLLTRLVDRSMVVAVRSGGRSRYRVPETLRAYGRGHLVAATGLIAELGPRWWPRRACAPVTACWTWRREKSAYGPTIAVYRSLGDDRDGSPRSTPTSPRWPRATTGARAPRSWTGSTCCSPRDAAHPAREWVGLLRPPFSLTSGTP